MLQSVSRTEGVVGLNILVEVNAAVRELAELSSLLDLCEAKVLSATRNLVRLAYVLCVRVHPPVSKPSIPCVSYLIVRSSLHHIRSNIPWLDSFHRRIGIGKDKG